MPNRLSGLEDNSGLSLIGRHKLVMPTNWKIENSIFSFDFDKLASRVYIAVHMEYGNTICPSHCISLLGDEVRVKVTIIVSQQGDMDRAEIDLKTLNRTEASLLEKALYRIPVYTENGENTRSSDTEVALATYTNGEYQGVPTNQKTLPAPSLGLASIKTTSTTTPSTKTENSTTPPAKAEGSKWRSLLNQALSLMAKLQTSKPEVCKNLLQIAFGIYFPKDSSGADMALVRESDGREICQMANNHHEVPGDKGRRLEWPLEKLNMDESEVLTKGTYTFKAKVFNGKPSRDSAIKSVKFEISEAEAEEYNRSTGKVTGVATVIEKTEAAGAQSPAVIAKSAEVEAVHTAETDSSATVTPAAQAAETTAATPVIETPLADVSAPPVALGKTMDNKETTYETPEVTQCPQEVPPASNIRIDRNQYSFDASKPADGYMVDVIMDGETIYRSEHELYSYGTKWLSGQKRITNRLMVDKWFPKTPVGIDDDLILVITMLANGKKSKPVETERPFRLYPDSIKEHGLGEKNVEFETASQFVPASQQVSAIEAEVNEAPAPVLRLQRRNPAPAKAPVVPAVVTPPPAQATPQEPPKPKKDVPAAIPAPKPTPMDLVLQRMEAMSTQVSTRSSQESVDQLGQAMATGMEKLNGAATGIKSDVGAVKSGVDEVKTTTGEIKKGVMELLARGWPAPTAQSKQSSNGSSDHSNSWSKRFATAAVIVLVALVVGFVFVFFFREGFNHMAAPVIALQAKQPIETPTPKADKTIVTEPQETVEPKQTWWPKDPKNINMAPVAKEGCVQGEPEAVAAFALEEVEVQEEQVEFASNRQSVIQAPQVFTTYDTPVYYNSYAPRMSGPVVILGGSRHRGGNGSHGRQEPCVTNNHESRPQRPQHVDVPYNRIPRGAEHNSTVQPKPPNTFNSKGRRY